MNVKAPEFAYWPVLMDRYIWTGEDGFAQRSGMFAIRSSRTGTEDLLAEAQQAIWSVNGRQPVFLVTTLETLYDQSMARTFQGNPGQAPSESAGANRRRS